MSLLAIGLDYLPSQKDSKTAKKWTWSELRKSLLVIASTVDSVKYNILL